MSIGLHILLIYSVILFFKASIILNMKVVPNDNFKFGGERVKHFASSNQVQNDLYAYTCILNSNGLLFFDFHAIVSIRYIRENS